MEQLQAEFDGELLDDAEEYILYLDNKLAKGEIRGFHLDTNFSYLEYNVTFSEDIQIVSLTPVTNPIYFLYCSKGGLTHSFGINGKRRLLSQFQTGIFSSEPSKNSVFLFQKNNEIQVCNIMVNTYVINESETKLNYLHNQLVKTFIPKNEESLLAYVGSHNLKIASKFDELNSIKETGMVRILLIRGIINMILAFEIQQHSKDIYNIGSKYGTLTSKEMDEVKEISNLINNYPERPFNIKYFCSKTGLSAAKLQKGFKILHNRTVVDYMRSVRLEYAENLIQTTDLNISEIVYTIGLTSRSYFSKIFKEKYNCSPKDYQERQTPTAI